MEQYELTTPNRTKFTITSEEVSNGWLTTVEVVNNDEDLAKLILSTLREWDDCEGYELLSEEDAGQEYTYWED